MKIKVAILENDVAYLNRLVMNFSTKYADKLEMFSFTSENLAYEALVDNKIDVLLASNIFSIEKDRIPTNCGFAYLVDSAEIESFNNEVAVNKFQKAEMIYKQITDLFSDNASHITSINSGHAGESKFISFLSASGGTGSSTVAASCAVKFAEMGKKVLYLNLEQFGSADVFFEADGAGSFRDIIYAIKGKKGNLQLKLETSVKLDSSGVYFYSATPMALDMAELTSSEIIELLMLIDKCGGYEYVILDMDFSLEKAWVEILNKCDKIVLVNDGSSTSNAKFVRALNSMQIIEEQGEMDLMSRVSYLYNRFSSQTSEMVEVENITMLGGIKRFEGYEARQLIQELAKNDVLGKLI